MYKTKILNQVQEDREFCCHAGLDPASPPSEERNSVKHRTEKSLFCQELRVR